MTAYRAHRRGAAPARVPAGTVRWEEETGSGTVLVLAVIGVVLSVGMAATSLMAVQSAAGRARSAADLAALGGATALSSLTAPGEPCPTARHVAEANGAALVSCTVRGEDVTVEVTVPAGALGLGRHATATARAGPVDSP